MFIAVHVGAGHLSRSKESRYKAALAKACEEGMTELRHGRGAMDAVACAIRVLENDPVTNAGTGSNLSLHGTVECDASIMDGKTGGYGAVGAVGGIKNPILAAKRMAQESIELLPLDRVPPMLLTGQGASDWAKQRGMQVDENLITPEAFDTYMRHMTMLADVNDTVGAIAVDAEGHVAAGVSSGGISLKYPGRVGEAAVYGCGCWAKEEQDTATGIACSTSGTGEQIMRTMITSKCVDQLCTEDDIRGAVISTIQRDFIESPLLKMYNEKSVGMIMLRTDKASRRTEFWYVHTTESMGIGSMFETAKKPKTVISRKTADEPIVSSGWLIR